MLVAISFALLDHPSQAGRDGRVRARHAHPRPLTAVLLPSHGLIADPPHLSDAHFRRPADRSVRLLLPFLARQSSTTSRLMIRLRAARLGIGGGTSGLQSDVIATHCLVRDGAFDGLARTLGGVLRVCPPSPTARGVSSVGTDALERSRESRASVARRV